MPVSKLAALIATLTLLFTTSVSAQSLAGSTVPAEFPPSSFKGNQYVDSKGCVFIRTGTSASTTWVRRMARNRQLICGFQPSQKETTAAASAQAVLIEPAPKSVRELVPKPKVVAKAKSPAPPKVQTSTPAAAQAVVIEPTPKSVRALVPKPKVVAKAKSPVPPKVQTSKPAAVLATGSILTPPSLRNDIQETSTQPQRTTATVLSGAGPKVQNARIAEPNRSQPACREASALSSQDINLGTLDNPARCGAQQSKFVGQAVTTTLDTQNNSQIEPRASQVTQATDDPLRLSSVTKSTPASHPFVQVGIYGVKGNATRAAERLATVGLPAKIERATLGGKTYQVVLAGPFQDQSALRAALQSARSAGFLDAFLRK
jgi:hypothetical protein